MVEDAETTNCPISRLAAWLDWLGRPGSQQDLHSRYQAFLPGRGGPGRAGYQGERGEDGAVKRAGRLCRGRRAGPWWLGCQGGGWLVGELDSQNKVEGEAIFLYPDLQVPRG